MEDFYWECVVIYGLLFIILVFNTKVSLLTKVLIAISLSISVICTQITATWHIHIPMIIIGLIISFRLSRKHK
jgi:hypothetical protein